MAKSIVKLWIADSNVRYKLTNEENKLLPNYEVVTAAKIYDKFKNPGWSP